MLRWLVVLECALLVTCMTLRRPGLFACWITLVGTGFVSLAECAASLRAHEGDLYRRNGAPEQARTTGTGARVCRCPIRNLVGAERVRKALRVVDVHAGQQHRVQQDGQIRADWQRPLWRKPTCAGCDRMQHRPRNAGAAGRRYRERKEHCTSPNEQRAQVCNDLAAIGARLHDRARVRQMVEQTTWRAVGCMHGAQKTP